MADTTSEGSFLFRKIDIPESGELMCFSSENNLLSCSNEMRQRQNFCDYSIIVAGETFPVHKLVLVASSDFFKVMLTTEMSEKYMDKYHVEMFDIETIKSILDFMYTGKICIKKENLNLLINAASYLQMISLMDVIGGYLISVLNVVNCIDIHHILSCFNIKKHQEKTLSYIFNNFCDIDTNKLSYEELLIILESDDLRLSSEFDVVDTVKNWMEVRYNIDFSNLVTTNFETEPWKEFTELTNKVRWGLIPSDELSEEFNELQIAMNQIPQCSGYLTEVNDYHQDLYRQPFKQSYRSTVRNKYVSVARFNSDTQSIEFMDLRNFSITQDDGDGLPESAELESPRLVSLNNFLFLCSKQSLYRYDPRFSDWMELQVLVQPGSIMNFILLNHGTRLYQIAIVMEVRHTMRSFVYDIENNSWSITSGMPEVKTIYSGCVHGDKIYVSGGIIESEYEMGYDEVIKTMYSFNTITEKWQQLASMQHVRYRHVMECIGDRLYAIGGMCSTSHVQFVDPIESYSIWNNQWTLCRQSISIHCLGSFFKNNSIYIVARLVQIDESFLCLYEFSEESDEVKKITSLSDYLDGSCQSCSLLYVPTYADIADYSDTCE